MAAQDSNKTTQPTRPLSRAERRAQKRKGGRRETQHRPLPPPKGGGGYNPGSRQRGNAGRRR